MYSIAFPDIFNKSQINLLQDKSASTNNLKLLLTSEKNSLFGDPFYGTNLQSIVFEQNTPLLDDVIIDEIYTTIVQFMPQLTVKRKNIKVIHDGTAISVSVEAINKLDNTTDLYNINLTENSNS